MSEENKNNSEEQMNEAAKSEAEEQKEKTSSEENKKESQDEKNSKTKKGSTSKALIAAVAVLSLVVIGLIIALVMGGKSKDKDESDKTDAVIQETTSDNASEDDGTGETDKDSEDENASTTETNNSSSTSDVFVTINHANGWEGDGKFYGQMDVAITNNSGKELSSWSVKVPVASGVEVDSCWNCSCEIKDGSLIITPADYNGTIAANSRVGDVGIIIKASAQADLDSFTKNPELYIGGKLYVGSSSQDSSAATTEEDKDEPDTTENNPPAVAETGTPFANHGKLSVNGTDLVDKNGNKYQLKGVSTHGIAWFPDYVNKDAFQTLRDDWGANLIRIAMYSGENMGYCTGGNQEQLKNLVDKGVQAATELGMYVIVDWHVLGDQN
ncbi:MAG: cellulase family glycosylhydrolase, partial [Wujia sp.]